MKFYIFFILSLFLLVSCGGGGGGGGSNGESRLSVSNLTGTWSFCENDPEAPQSSYKYKAIFSGNNLTFNFISYAGLNCLDANKESTETTTYSYSLSSNSITTVVSLATLTIHVQTNAVGLDLDSVNTISYCGYSDWTLNTPKIITNLYCDDYIVSTGDSSTNEIIINGNQLTMESIIYNKEN